MNLKELRDALDAVDSQIVSLYAERMRLSAEVARVKKSKGLPVRDPVREAEKLQSVSSLAPEYEKELRELFALLMAQSRALQESMIGEKTS